MQRHNAIETPPCVAAESVEQGSQKPAWSEAEVRAVIASNRFTYQNVPLPYGLETGGADRSGTANLVLPPAMTGKSLLDIGCMYGYFCFEAERRGAARVVGADVDRENVRKSRLLAACKGSGAEFMQLDIETQEIAGQFDYVLCLNVLHHLRNPLAVLEKLIAAAREAVVLEIATFSDRDRRKSEVPFLLAGLLNRLPLIYLGGSDPRREAKQTFFITKAALQTMLLRHRRSFTRLDIMDGGHKGRFIAVARKRRINHLFVVAGVPAAGKTTLIECLRAGRDPHLAAKLGFRAEESWLDFHDGDVDDPDGSGAPNVILHYNILKPLIDGDLYLHDRMLLDLIKASRQVSFVTVWCPPALLLERYTLGRTGDRRKTMISPRYRKKGRMVRELYQRTDELAELFRDWFAFCGKHGGGPVVVNEAGGYRLTAVDELQRHEPAFLRSRDASS